MPAASNQVASAGLVGALTSLFVSAAASVLPDSNFRSIISIMSGLTASVVAFEIISWFVVIRLKQTRNAISKLIPVIQSTQSEIVGAIAGQIDIMKQNGASATSLRTLEKIQIDSAEELARSLAELQRRNLTLLRDIGSL